MQRSLRVITLQGAIKKSPILLSRYWKNEWLDGNIIISYFGGSNNIFADPILFLKSMTSLETIFSIILWNNNLDWKYYCLLEESKKV